MRPRKAGLKILFSSGLSVLMIAFGAGHGLGIRRQLHQLIGAGVGGQNNNGVLEVDLAAFAVFHFPLSKT